MSQNYNSINSDDGFPFLDDDPNIDKILEICGYGYYQWMSILSLSFVTITFGMQMSISSALYTPLKNSLNQSDSNFALLTGLMFLGVAFGSISSGFMTENLGRRITLLFSVTILFFLTLSLAFSVKYIIYFTIIQFLCGFFFGVIMPIPISNLPEFLPIYLRCFALTSACWTFGIGALYIFTLMLIFTPNYEISGLKPIFILLSIPYILLFLFLFFTFEESPRYLILIANKKNEGIELLEKISNKKFNQEQKIKILNNLNEGINKDLEDSIKTMFTPKFLKTTLILMLAWVGVAYINYGSIFVFQKTLLTINKSGDNKPIRYVIIQQIISVVISLPANFLAGALSEIKHLGRIKSISGFFFLSSIMLFFAVIFLQNFNIFFGFFSFVISAAYDLTISYTSEIYPTKLRNKALGFLYFCTRISGFASQFISLSLEGYMFLLQYYFSIIFALVICGFILILPFETNGEPLDSDIEVKN